MIYSKYITKNIKHKIKPCIWLRENSNRKCISIGPRIEKESQNNIVVYHETLKAMTMYS